MFMLLGVKLPIEGDKVTWEGWEFEIMDMDRKTIDKVLATKIVEPFE
jgi:putative hemolysin